MNSPVEDTGLGSSGKTVTLTGGCLHQLFLYMVPLMTSSSNLLGNPNSNRVKIVCDSVSNELAPYSSILKPRYAGTAYPGADCEASEA